MIMQKAHHLPMIKCNWSLVENLPDCSLGCVICSLVFIRFSSHDFQMNETTLPECEHSTVCNKIDVYDKPWIEKQCKCPTHTPACSSSTISNDGHTISDKTRLYKVLSSVFTIKCVPTQTTRL
jgi:hypothetical protein